MREACCSLPSFCLPHQVLFSICHMDLKCCNILLLRRSFIYQDVEYPLPFLTANELPGTSILQEQIHPISTRYSSFLAQAAGNKESVNKVG